MAGEQTADRHEWIAGFAHWGQSDIYYFCSEAEWDGNLRVNGGRAMRVADYMKPEAAEKIVALHNTEIASAKEADRAMDILRWLAKSDHGISSEVLALASVGVTSSRWGNQEPGDENDCGRCERLAAACPFVLDALPGLTGRNPGWEPWADRIRNAVNV